MLTIKKRISHRFFMAFMLVAVIPIGIMGYQSYILAKKALTSSAFLHISTIAKDHARHLDAWLKERLGDIDTLSKLPTIREVCQEHSLLSDRGLPSERSVASLTDILKVAKERSPSYENIYILLPDGQVLASIIPHPEEIEKLQNFEVLQRLRNTEEPVFGPAFQHEDKRWRLHGAAHILNRDGQRLGIVLAVLDISRMIDPFMMDRIGLGETGETFLVNTDGQIISESRFLSPAETQNRSFDTPGIRAALNWQDGTALYQSYTGKEVLGSYLWLPRYEWAILAEIETDEIMRPLVWIKTMGLLTALLVTTVCILLAYAVSVRVSKPIIQMAHAAQAMTDGQLDQRIPFSSKDEVGILAASFNTMAQQLSELITSLRLKEESLHIAYNELISAQEQLVQSEKMAAIGELVACVAHEMRNPLSSVKLNIQIIGRSLPGDPMMQEHYQIALDQVKQLEKMFSDLLNYSKPLILEKNDVSLSEVLDRSLQQLESQIQNRNIHIQMMVQRSLPPVHADLDKLGQVFSNVLKNAIEASGQDGRIEVSIGLSEFAGRTAVAACITDHGKGIPGKNLASLYRPFFSTKKKGTGLGLSIVKKIVDAHHGDVSITSIDGRGTTVQITFPCV